MSKKIIELKQLKNTFLKQIVLILSFILIININNAQDFSGSVLNVGVKLGGSRLLGEVTNSFSEIINEFDNKTGFSATLELSKHISPKWEFGAEIGSSSLIGDTYSSTFSAEGFQPGIPTDINEPTEYINKLNCINFLFRYYFVEAGSESLFIPFVSAGGGILNYNSKFKYIDAPADDLLFGKGTEGYTTLSTPVFMVGTGFKTHITSHLYFVASIDFNFVDYDFLDVIHNYDSTGNRLEITGLYTDFNIGIFYNFSKSGENKNNGKKGNKGRSSHSGHLPFAR